MKIIGIEGMSEEQMQDELAHGAKLVYFEYCISILVMTFKRSSELTFIKRDENAFVKGLGYTLMSLLLGWWGFPWGPIYTIGAVINNCKGGKDVTSHFMGANTVASGTPPGKAVG
jgi:hypothetical protein